MKAKFFTFQQNNSGGNFIIDKVNGVDEFVIIEAYNADEANSRAESLGLYFDGIGDCECCGYRWGQVWDDEGTDEPEIFGERPDKYNNYFIHYLDGRVEGST